jgi:hypothetical protein
MNPRNKQLQPNQISKRYGLGKEFGYVELNSDGTVIFTSLIENVDGPWDWGVQILPKHVPVLRAIIEHLERGGFDD